MFPMRIAFLLVLLVACDNKPGPSDAGLDSSLPDNPDAALDTNNVADEPLNQPWLGDVSTSFPAAITCSEFSETITEPEVCLTEADCVGGELAEVFTLDTSCIDTRCAAFSRMGSLTADADGLVIGGERTGDIPLPSGYVAPISSRASDVLIASGTLEVSACADSGPCVRSAALAFANENTSEPSVSRLDVLVAVRLVVEPSLGADPQIQFVLGRDVYAHETLTLGEPVEVQIALFPSGQVAFFARQGAQTYTPDSAQVGVPEALAFSAYGYGDGNARPEARIRSARLQVARGFWPEAGERALLPAQEADRDIATGGAYVGITRESDAIIFTTPQGDTFNLENRFPSDSVRLLHHTGLSEPRYGLFWDQGGTGFAYAAVLPEDPGDVSFQRGGARVDSEVCALPPAPDNIRVFDVMMYHNSPILLGADGTLFQLYGLQGGSWHPLEGFAFESTATAAKVSRAFGHTLVATEIPQGTRSRIELWVFQDEGESKVYDLVSPSGETGDPDAFGAAAPALRTLEDFLSVFYTGDSRITTQRMRIDIPVPTSRRIVTLPVNTE